MIMATGLAAGVMSVGLPAFAQDSDESQVAETDARRSQPGVVRRQAPSNPAEPARNETTQSVGVEGGVIFGESLDFEQNFGNDFNVRTSPRNLRITLDFRDAELSDVVKLMSAQTGRNFIIADSLRAGKKITIISPNPVSQVEAYQAFLSALQMNGLTVVQSGRFYKIVETAVGVKEPIAPTFDDARVANNDALVTHIISLEFIEATQMKPVLEQLKTTAGVIIDYAPSNTLIITDTGASVNRMLSFIRRMDNGSNDGEKIWVYPVQYASVTDMERLLSQVFQIQTAGRGGQPAASAASSGSEDIRISQIVADERTNKLIIVANERSYEKMKRLILKLDVEIPDSGKINVIHLQNSEASEIYSALNQIISDMSANNARSGGQGNAQTSQRTLQGENISVVANPSTNDLIVVASPRDFLAIKNVIRELDRPRRQVFVEAVIMEVSLERSRDLGVAMHGGGGNIFDTSSGFGYAGRTELNSLNSLTPATMFLGPGSVPGFLMALAGPSFQVGNMNIPSIGAVITALQTNTDVNVLSTPTILTLDNQEAEISVGERIPYVTNTGSNLGALAGLAGDQSSMVNNILGGGGLGYGTQIERVDVALTLRIKPQINEGGTVRLDIQEEIEEVKPGGTDLGGPSTRMRSLKTVVVVPDQQTVVLGGLVRDSESQSVSKVPLLGDIPVLGYLFRSSHTTIQKQNLLLMLTPYIIESNADLEKISQRKQKEREEFLAFFGRKDLGYVRSVNFDKKHGLLEDIRQSIDAKESELSAIREAQNIVEFYIDDEGIDLPAGFSDGYSTGGGGGGAYGRGQQQRRTGGGVAPVGRGGGGNQGGGGDGGNQGGGGNQGRGNVRPAVAPGGGPGVNRPQGNRQRPGNH
ncbi:MAG: type II secretion system secretin GspD [Proteobacteria bacterium]|nr:type II secretion system secretin GspD [Pseudomonadota bacterium]